MATLTCLIFLNGTLGLMGFAYSMISYINPLPNERPKAARAALIYLLGIPTLFGVLIFVLAKGLWFAFNPHSEDSMWALGKDVKVFFCHAIYGQAEPPEKKPKVKMPKAKVVKNVPP